MKIESLSLKKIFPKKAPRVVPWLFFKELEDSLNIIEDLDQISLNFLGKIREVIPVKTQLLLVYDQDLGKFKACNFFGYEGSDVEQASFSRADLLVKWLKVNKTYFYKREQPGILNYLTQQERDILESLGIEVCYPLVSMNRLIGIIFLGKKENGEPFFKHELALLSSVTPQIGIALENSLLYREQRERFRRMLRADRLATIGELAAGAAHEIRNPLTAIKSSLQYLEVKSQDETGKNLLNRALQETDRINEILSGLLSFSRPTEMKKEKASLLETLEESLDLISFQARKQNVEIVREYSPSSFFLHGDKSQLKQLFLNLFLNSIQSMKEGGTLRVEVAPKEDRKVLILISDTGEGISEENVDKIFDPFFTTKKGGTGLGLSICYGIVKSHGGDIEIKSRLNQGTTAMINLPLSF